MSASPIRSIQVSVEPSFGNVEAATGLPTTNGLTWRSLEADRASLETFGDVAMNEREEARDGPHGVPPEPSTVWAAGVRVQRRTGTITVTCPVRPLGAGNTGAAVFAYTDLPLFQLLNSGMWDAGASASTSDTVGAAITVNQITAGATANYNLGELVSVVEGNRFEVAGVTRIQPVTISVSPAFSSAPAVQELRTMRTLYVHNSLSVAALGGSVALRIDGVGWRTEAFGCRMASARLALKNKQLIAEVVIDATYIRDDHANAATAEPVRTDAAPVHFLNSYAVISGAVATEVAAPASLSRRTLNLDDVEITITNTLTPAGFSDNVLAMSNKEITQVEIDTVLTLSAPSTLMTADFRNQATRSLMIGFAGEFASASATEVGNGFAVYIPSAFLTVDPDKRDLTLEIVRQVLNYKPGRFYGDTGTGGAADSMFRLGFGN